MRGIDNIISMRLSREKPSAVFVEMLPMQQWTKAFTEHAGRHVDIHLEPKDVPGIALEDLRCLVGLSVYVRGPADDSTQRVAEACLKAGAKLVQAFFFDLSKPEVDWIVKAMRFDSTEVRTVWPK